MNVYIFVTNHLGGIGGAQRYCVKKAEWLRRQGWHTFVVGAAQQPEVYAFDEYAGVLRTRDIHAMPRYVGFRRRSKLLAKLLEIIPAAREKTVVESCSEQTALWGEYIARAIKAKHLTFILDEGCSRKSKTMHQFLEFKDSRGELAYIRESIYRANLGKTSSPDDETHTLIAHLGSPVVDIPFDTNLVEPSADMTIGILSRLDKPYIRAALESVVKFANNHREDTFLLLFVGGTAESTSANEIDQLVSYSTNISTCFLPPMAQIPRQLLAMFDVALEKAGCARLTASEGIPTIAYTLDNDICAGIWGCHFARIPTSDEAEAMSCEFLLERILYRRDVEIDTRLLPQQPIARFERHFDFLEASVQSTQYFDALAVRAASTKNAALQLLCSLTRKSIWMLRRGGVGSSLSTTVENRCISPRANSLHVPLEAATIPRLSASGYLNSTTRHHTVLKPLHSRSFAIIQYRPPIAQPSAA